MELLKLIKDLYKDKPTKKCALCKTKRLSLHSHHIIPKFKGGNNDKENLIDICANCHQDIHHIKGMEPWLVSQNPETNKKRSVALKKAWANGAFTQERNEKVSKSMTDNKNGIGNKGNRNKPSKELNELRGKIISANRASWSEEKRAHWIAAIKATKRHKNNGNILNSK